MTDTNKINLIGAIGSPYTRKMVSLLRYRGIPYKVTWGQPEVILSAMGVEPPRPALLPTFVFPDGNTQIPQVRTESYLYEAALKLKDGELASEPIPDGNYFAAIWRRGTLPAKTESVEELSPMIREILADQAAKEALSRMIVTLRKMAKVESFPELLDSVESAVVDWPQAPGASQAAP